MRALIQRVCEARVTVDDVSTGEIAGGLLVLLGVERDDDADDVRWTAEKCLALRIFPDEQDRMNRSVIDIGGSLLVVSQFTLYADVRKGRRPGFDRAAPPVQAQQFYEMFVAVCRERCVVETGRFQAAMRVALINDGPVTILVDSADRKQKTPKAVDYWNNLSRDT